MFLVAYKGEKCKGGSSSNKDPSGYLNSTNDWEMQVDQVGKLEESLPKETDCSNQKVNKVWWSEGCQ